MKIYLPSVITLLCSIFLLSACSKTDNKAVAIQGLDDLIVTPSTKGWELYSWPDGNTRKFSFLVGTNRVKSLSEVTSSNGTTNLIIVTGTDSAKMVLNRFPPGENIMLVGQGWLQSAWMGQYGNLGLPPQSVIDELKSFCSQKNLTFTVAN